MIRLFRKKENDPDQEARERFRTDFGLFSQRRFPPVDEGSYACRLKRHALCLELRKKNHFAWVPADRFQYRDFLLEAELSFDPENGHSAAGFIFRWVNNENFYYFLLSNGGAFRFDVLFNGHPLRLIEWTPSALLDGDRNDLRIIARDEHFSFYLGDEWIAEIDDGKLPAGRIGVAGQNFGEEDSAVLRFHRLLLESRPVEVEKAYWRWARYIPAEASSRVALARTLSQMGNFSAAVVELKKALKFEEENKEALFLFALCAVNLKVYDQALTALDRLLRLEPGRADVLVEKANALYLSNEFLKARDFIRAHLSDLPESSTIWNLLGNCEHALGNREAAAAAYAEAGRRDPSMPLYLVNRARMLEQGPRPAEALGDYLTAARLLFRQEAYDDLSLILPRIAALDPKNAEVQGFEAKMLFHENRRAEAKPLLENLIKAGAADSALHYLSALIAIDEGRREDAVSELECAAGQEPGYALYWWRLAESKRILRRDYRKDIEKARALSPDDPWVCNLSGLACLDRGDEEGALDFFTQAHAGAPRDIDILINYTEMLSRTGKQAEAIKLLEGAVADDPAAAGQPATGASATGQPSHGAPITGPPITGPEARLRNHLGNLAAGEKRYEEAVAQYERAIRLDPANPLYLENCAAACLELEMITRAEELLVKALDLRPSAAAYNLLGNLCMIRTEYLRAEYCYEEGLRLEPGHRELGLNMASLAVERSRYDKAKSLLAEALRRDPADARAIHVHGKLREKFELRFMCSSCQREWWVFRDIPLKEVGKIRGEPPSDSPAGQCPRCQKIFCIACVQGHLRDKRFACPDCGEFLKLSDNYLRHLVVEHLEQQARALPDESTGKTAADKNGE